MANKAIPGPFKEIVEGATTHGGIFKVTYFFDEKYKPVAKEDADRAIVHEYDEKSRSVFRDYLFFNENKESEQLQEMTDEQYDEMLAKQAPARPPKSNFVSAPRGYTGSHRPSHVKSASMQDRSAMQSRSLAPAKSGPQGKPAVNAAKPNNAPPAKKTAPPGKQSASRATKKPGGSGTIAPSGQAAKPMPVQAGQGKPQYKKAAPQGAAAQSGDSLQKSKAAVAFTDIQPRPISQVRPLQLPNQSR